MHLKLYCSSRRNLFVNVCGYVCAPSIHSGVHGDEISLGVLVSRPFFV